jgi:putative transcriptional regulator
LTTHHPTEPTLLAYASGSLPEALAIVAATHLGHCAACRRSLTALEAAAGALLDDLAPIPLGADALQRLLARAEEPARATPPILHPELPAPLNRVPLGRWWPVGYGIRFRPLNVVGGAWGGLIAAQPGRALPRHGHVGRELTCVLSGSFADGAGEYLAGDLSEPVHDHDQPPLVVGSEPCLCIIASEGMRLRGLLGIAQRIIRP